MDYKRLGGHFGSDENVLYLDYSGDSIGAYTIKPHQVYTRNKYILYYANDSPINKEKIF